MRLHLADSLCFPSMKTSSSELQESTWISAAAELFATFTYLVLASIYPWREELALDPASRFSSQEGSHTKAALQPPSLHCIQSDAVLTAVSLDAAFFAQHWYLTVQHPNITEKKVAEKCLLICLFWKLFISTNICDEEGALNASADNYY